jgi:HSP20 family protein
MKIVPRDPWFGIDDFFDDLFAHRQLTNDSSSFQPRVDIIEKDDQYVFVAELPGVKKEDISVKLQEGMLTIEAKVDEEKTSETDHMIRKERRSGFFSRSINVGENIEAGEIKAEFTNGLLKLTAPKAKKSTKEVQKIEIL